MEGWERGGLNKKKEGRSVWEGEGGRKEGWERGGAE